MVDIDARYAGALLKAAMHTDALSEVAEDMRALGQGFAASAMAFAAPVFSIGDQTETVAGILEGKIHPLTMRFVYLLISMRRMEDIARIASVYDRLSNKAAGYSEVDITLYEQASKDTESALIKAAADKGLIKAGGTEKLKIHSRVDKRLLGGFIMECDGFSWDCSLRTRLLDMARTMRKPEEIEQIEQSKSREVT